MPELPALPLGAPVVGRRATRASPRPRLQGPGAIAQEARLAPRLQRLTNAFLQGRLTTPADPAALPPEQVIVLEVAGELGDFNRAVRRIPGLEFLAEEAEDRLESDATFAAVDRDGKPHRYTRQLFLVASDAVAWQQLLGLWQRFQRGDPFPYGLTPFRDLFARLRDVRAWDDRDRLERTGALSAWREDFVGMDAQLVEFETELWLRGEQERRDAVLAALRSDLADVGGTIVDQLVVEEIDYHGVLARVPARNLLGSSGCLRGGASWVLSPGLGTVSAGDDYGRTPLSASGAYAGRSISASRFLSSRNSRPFVSRLQSLPPKS